MKCYNSSTIFGIIVTDLIFFSNKLCLPNCQSDDDCFKLGKGFEGFSCMADGSCQMKCQSNIHCHEGKVCFSDGSCKHSCQKKNDCQSGQYCHLDHKVCHDLCTSDDSCTRGYKCSNGSCYQQCSSYKKCSDKQFCTE